MSKSAGLKTCLSCTECQRRHRPCIQTSPGGTCELCASSTPPRVCLFSKSHQGQRNDLSATSTDSFGGEEPSESVRVEKSPPKLTPRHQNKSREAKVDQTNMIMKKSLVAHTCNTMDIFPHDNNDDNNATSPHISHHGLDLDRFISRDLNEHSSFSTQPKGGACSGTRRIFEVVHGTNELKAHPLTSRVGKAECSMNVGFIESTQFLARKLKRRCRGVIIAFKCVRGQTTWHFGIIGELSHRTVQWCNEEMNRYDGMLTVYQWTGSTKIMPNGSCVPDLFLAQTKHQCNENLTLRHIPFKKGCGLKFHFLNQFSGSLPWKGKMAVELINHLDGCLQCSHEGPDHFPIELDRITKRDVFLAPSELFEVTEKWTLHPSTVVKNNFSNSKWRLGPVKLAQDKNDDLVANWNKGSKVKISSHSMVTVAVVTKADGTPLDLATATNLNPEFANKSFVPSPSDFVARSTIQRIYVIDDSNYDLLMARNESGGVPLVDVDQFLINHSECCINTVCINDNVRWDECPCYHLFSQIFGGRAAPSTDQYESFHSERLGLIVYYAMKPASEVQQFTPLSTSLVDGQFHKFVLTHREVEIIDNAFRPRGTYSNRNVARSHGHCSYQGLKTDTSQSHPTPTEGPGLKAEYLLYRQHVDTRYFAKAMHIINDLAYHMRPALNIFYKPLGIIFNDPSLFLGLCRIAIYTRDFDNNSHIDKHDEFSATISAELMRMAHHISKSELTIRSEKERIDNFISFGEDFTHSVATSCGYQFTLTSLGLLHSETTVKVCQVFLMLGLGMCLRISNFWSHLFTARVFQHCTCMAVFISNGHVFFGKHPYVSVVAWGLGDDGVSNSEAKQQARKRRKQNKDRNKRARTRNKHK